MNTTNHQPITLLGRFSIAALFVGSIFVAGCFDDHGRDHDHDRIDHRDHHDDEHHDFEHRY